MAASDVVQIGPFSGGLNSYSDPTAVLDNELVMAENMELDLDGSLVSRPPFMEGPAFPLGASGNMLILGYYFAANGTPYLIASDGLTKTYYFTGTSWVLITNTFAASAMTQYNNLAYLQAPLSSTNPGGSWSPTAGFTAINAIPKGNVIIAHKSRLWAASGAEAVAGQNGTRIYLSKIADPTTWDGTFIDIGPGDGQNIVKIIKYFDDLLIFKTASIYRFAFSTDPATGSPSQLSPTIGIAGRDCVVTSDSIVYFVYADKVYQISNYQITQINQKVPLVAATTSSNYYPVSAGLFNNRLIVSYYDTMYVYSLRTQRWTTWKSSQYGSIGRIVELNISSNTHTAIAHSSAPAPFGAVDTNRVLDPRSATLSHVTARQGFSTPLTPTTVTGATPPTEAPTLTTRTRVQATATTTSLDIREADITVTAGQVYSFSAYMYSPVGAAGAYSLIIRWTDTAGNTIRDNNTGPTFSSRLANPVRVKYDNLQAPVGATRVIIIAVKTGNIVTGNRLEVNGWQATLSNATTGYIDGASTDANGIYTYTWSGTANNSTSVRTAIRNAKTLIMQDQVPAVPAEAFNCTVVTKNYDYQAPSMFKRIFYWGVDASFQGQLQAFAAPIRTNSATASATWDQLLTTTWDQLLSTTWDNLTGSDSGNLLTQVDTTAVNGVRKFVKLGNKSFRFRQVYFRLVFSVNGTKPVRLFTIITRVNTKQTVSKQVS